MHIRCVPGCMHSGVTIYGCNRLSDFVEIAPSLMNTLFSAVLKIVLG